MTVNAVIGLGFGDEGKGLIVDYLCNSELNKQTYSCPFVMRFSGGQNAGHTVVRDGVRHIFSSFGSGTLCGVSTYISNFCTVSPVAIFNEYNILKSKGINPKLFIDPECPVTTLYDEMHNQNNLKSYAHGTTGVGLGATFEREEHNYHLHFSDLFYPNVLREKLELIAEYYCNNQTYLPTEFLQAYEWIVSCKDIIMSGLPIKDTVICEGSQGLLLDKDIGFFPHVTRSNTGSKNIRQFFNTDQIRYYLVTRAYQTRHGRGPMTNEDIPHNIKINPDETNKSHKFQGEFRRSLLDLDLIEYAISKDGHFHHKRLAITCLDHIENEWRFTYKNKIVNCINENEFIEKIMSTLGIYSVLTSHSDCADQINRVDRKLSYSNLY